MSPSHRLPGYCIDSSYSTLLGEPTVDIAPLHLPDTKANVPTCEQLSCYISIPCSICSFIPLAHATFSNIPMAIVIKAGGHWPSIRTKFCWISQMLGAANV